MLNEGGAAAIPEDEDLEHGWVKELKKSWLMIDDYGDRLVNKDARTSGDKYPRAYLASDSSTSVIASKKGLIRFLTIVIDMTQSMQKNDYKHDRIDFIVNELVTSFIPRFFELNPLSCISLISLRDGKAKFITRMGGQPKSQCTRLKQFIDRQNLAGKATLSLALDLVISSSKDIPGYATREVLVIWGSISSQDALEKVLIPTMLEKVQAAQVKVSVVSLEPEVNAIRQLAEGSGGRFSVSLNSHHCKTLLESHLNPPDYAALKPLYIKMGFPACVSLAGGAVTRCMCHNRLISTYHVCPQCLTEVCEIPVTCPLCRLTLADRDMLTGVHRHLYRMPNFKLLESPGTCAACASPFDDGGAQCQNCMQSLCYECDVFAHSSLLNCPCCSLTRRPI